MQTGRRGGRPSSQAGGVDLNPPGFDKRRAALIVLGAGATRGASFVADASVLQPPLDGDFFLQFRACDLAQEQDGQALLEFVDAEFGESDPSMEAFYSQVYLHDQYQIELYISIVQRMALTPNDFARRAKAGASPNGVTRGRRAEPISPREPTYAYVPEEGVRS